MTWKKIVVYATAGTVAIGSAVTFPKLRSTDSESHSKMFTKRVAVLPGVIVGSAAGIIAAVNSLGSNRVILTGGPTTDSEVGYINQLALLTLGRLPYWHQLKGCPHHQLKNQERLVIHQGYVLGKN